MAFEGIIPAVTTPFTADDQVDVAALKENIEKLIEAGVHGFVATGTMGEAGSLTREERALVVRSVVEAADGRVPVTVGVSAGSAAAVAGVRRRRQGRGRAVRHVRCRRSATAPTRTRSSPSTPTLATCGLPVMAYNNPEASGVDMPAALIARIYEEVDARHRDQGVLGRHAPDPGPAAPRRRPRGRRRRRRLGARGLRRRRDRLDHRRRRARPGRDRRALRGRPGQRPGAGARRVPSAAPRRPLRHDLQARPVLQGRPGRRRLQRRPDARAAPAAEGRRGRRARGGARHPARAGRASECEPPATSRRSTPTRRGCRRASSRAASAPSRARRCWSASSTSRRTWTTCGCC